MRIDTGTAISMTEAQQNFSKVTSLVDRLGQVEENRVAFDHEVRISSMKLMEKFDDAFKELSK